jgi:hypothetical protein
MPPKVVQSLVSSTSDEIMSYMLEPSSKILERQEFDSRDLICVYMLNSMQLAGKRISIQSTDLMCVPKLILVLRLHRQPHLSCV